MVFQEGHKINEKLSSDELKLEAYRQYCEHLSQGCVKKSWYFEHPELSITWETMEKYIKQYPDILDPKHKEVAQAKGLKHWEKVLDQTAHGNYSELNHGWQSNVAALQIVLRNKFKWERKDDDDEDKGKGNLEAFEQIMELMKSRQNPVKA